ncbi:MAG: asparagine synthase (glutamine-hydrolyzing) [Pseudomonadota bacterium]
MCGICGSYSQNTMRPKEMVDLQNMNQALKHRGPDDEGYLFINDKGTPVELKGTDTISALGHLPPINNFNMTDKPVLCMGHRRLSILDVSKKGHQPMQDHATGSWIVFNGEIYNYIELRETLQSKGHVFLSDTDTEVVLKAYNEWGVDCLHRFNGMWAFVIWDPDKKQLFCARDRFGVKPFYYARQNGQFLFASEIKSLLQHSAIPKKENERIIWDYLYLSLADHTSETFFEDIFQLMPGHFMIVNAHGELNIKRYYKLKYRADLGQHEERGFDKTSKEFFNIFEDAVNIRLRSDVPVGSYLSGGIDSSSILCMVEQSLDKLSYRFKTFSSVSSNKLFDEKEYMDEIIKKIDIDPVFHMPDPKALNKDIDQLVYYQDEPFNSLAIYAQWSLMKTVKSNEIKVILAGDGADEILCGYASPYTSLFLLDLLKSGRLFDYYKEFKGFGAKLSFLHTLRSFYWLMPSFIRKPIRAKLNVVPKIIDRDFLNTYLWREEMWIDKLYSSSLQKRLYHDMTESILPHELRFRERNAMAFSIEERQPFLDYRLVELCYAAPAVYKIYMGWRKYLLRKAMNGYLPPSIQWRKKKLGFGTHELRWIDQITLKNTDRLRSSPYINESMFASYANSNKINSPIMINELWSFYNLELWMETFKLNENQSHY